MKRCLAAILVLCALLSLCACGAAAPETDGGTFSLDILDTGKSDCIIVGRCANHILREQKPVRIFAYADMESRIERCMERRPEDENLTEAQMKKRITEIDRNRAKYYAFFSGQKWGARENYDLLVNTSGADIKKMSFALCGYLEALFE